MDRVAYWYCNTQTRCCAVGTVLATSYSPVQSELTSHDSTQHRTTDEWKGLALFFLSMLTQQTQPSSRFVCLIRKVPDSGCAVGTVLATSYSPVQSELTSHYSTQHRTKDEWNGLALFFLSMLTQQTQPSSRFVCLIRKVPDSNFHKEIGYSERGSSRFAMSPDRQLYSSALSDRKNTKKKKINN